MSSPAIPAMTISSAAAGSTRSMATAGSAPDTHGTGSSGPIVTTPDVDHARSAARRRRRRARRRRRRRHARSAAAAPTRRAMPTRDRRGCRSTCQFGIRRRRGRHRHLDQHRECHRLGLQRLRSSAMPATMCSARRRRPRFPARPGTATTRSNGGDDDDFLNGGLGDDILDGGSGWDRATYSTGATAGVTVDLNIVGVAQNTGSQGFDTLIGIEHVSGTRFDDVLTGDGGDNWIWGGSDGSGVTGNDTSVGRRRQRSGPGRHRQPHMPTAALGTDTLLAARQRHRHHRRRRHRLAGAAGRGPGHRAGHDEPRPASRICPARPSTTI